MSVIPSPEYFSHVYTYVKWADLRQLDSIKPLSDEEYFKDRGWSFGNIHKLLLHCISAQNVWLDRFEGRKPVWIFDDPRYARRDSIEPMLIQTHTKMSLFLEKQAPQALAAVLTYPNLKGEIFSVPLWQLIVHVCNHSMHHRGQINSMIKLAGGNPPQVDYSAWATLHGGMR
jgi:uncharacterized damage-inducible protein DinB